MLNLSILIMQFQFHHQLVSKYLFQVMNVDQVLEDDQPKIMTDHCIVLS